MSLATSAAERFHESSARDRIRSQRGSQPRLARCESLRPCLFERQIPRRLLCERLESWLHIAGQVKT